MSSSPNTVLPRARVSGWRWTQASSFPEEGKEDHSDLRGVGKSLGGKPWGAGYLFGH